MSRVVRRTRLWALEKVEVVDELLAHFADGLEAGATLDELIDAFGDERQAARLIRRAKKRNRPLLWHALRVGTWLMAVLLLLYAVIAVRFLVGHPSPTVDYIEQLNRPRLQVPVEQRGWPIYRKAILALGDRSSNEAGNRLGKLLNARPGGKHWPELIPWLQDHAQAVELARHASEKPRLGFILGISGSVDDAEMFPKYSETYPKYSRPSDGPLMSVLLPHLSDLKLLADVLWADARVAQQQGDPVRVMRDIDALLHLAEQMHQDNDFLISDLIALGIRSAALAAADEALADKQLKLSDAHLQRLAHRLSWPKVAADLFSLSVERLNFHDVVQRAYTDDGHGDGCLTLDGHQFLLTCAVSDPKQRSGDHLLSDVLQGALVPVPTASRRDVLERYDGLMDIADANLRLPLREASWAACEQRVLAWRTSGRLAPLVTLIPGSFVTLQARAERYLGQRDGLVVGIALELYRRQRGEYPATLDTLVPQYLPAIPADRISGDPVRYRFIAGRPVVYSVGADRKDDGGQPSLSPTGHPDPWLAVDFTVRPEHAVSGDWILYPQPEPEPESTQGE
ncbi:MAG: hypothetical protein ABSH20_23065 [Tepidisphaeraceae bacterium]